MRRRSRVVPVLVSGLVVLVGALAPPAAGAAVRPGLIVFSSGFILNDPDTEHPSQVLSVRPDGSRESQLTHVPDGKQAGAPDLSPDGTTIVYVSNEGADNFAVWAMKADGTGQHRVFGRDGFDFFQPHWSSGGRRLVVTRCDLHYGFRSACDLLITRPDGSHKRLLVGGGRIHGDARFSPNGKRLVVSSNCCRPASQVFTMRADGSHLRRLTHVTAGGGAGFASYAPGGHRIVFTSDQRRKPNGDRNDLFVMRTDGTHVHRIVEDQRGAVGADWGQEGR